MYRCKGFWVSVQERAAMQALNTAARLFPFSAQSAARNGVESRNLEQGIAHAALLIVYETGLRPSQARSLAVSVLQKPWFD